VNPADLERVARAHGIRLLVQFGSTVTGRTHAKSDVDVAALLERPDQTLDEHATMLHDVQALFPDRELDLAILNHADPLFLKQVMDTARLLYGTDTDLRRLQLLAFRRYQDHRKYLELERRFVSDAVRGPARRG
jgi:predicted nucleotidyltransferase